MVNIAKKLIFYRGDLVTGVFDHIWRYIASDLFFGGLVESPFKSDYSLFIGLGSVPKLGNRRFLGQNAEIRASDGFYDGYSGDYGILWVLLLWFPLEVMNRWRMPEVVVPRIFWKKISRGIIRFI